MSGNRSDGWERYQQYDPWAQLYNETLGPTYASYNIGMLERTLLPGIPRGARLLDLCCGTGHLTRALLDRGYEVIGIDGSAAMLQFAKINAPTATFLLDDIRHFDVQRPIDAAFSTGAALNHLATIEEISGVFSNVANLLAHGQVFVFDMNPAALMRRHWNGRVVNGHITQEFAWSITTEYESASNSGFFVVDIYHGPPNTAPGTSHSPLNPLLRKLPSVEHAEQVKHWLLERFDRLFPEWQRKTLSYDVYGYDIAEIEHALRSSGFTELSVKTTDGTVLSSEELAVCFSCTK